VITLKFQGNFSSTLRSHLHLQQGKGKGAIANFATSAHFPSLGRWDSRWIYHRVCDAWL